MKNLFAGAAVLGLLGLSMQALAGNKDRTGQAGASELLVNPWGQSTGLFYQNTATVKGLEAMKCNIAGLAFVEKLDIGLSHTEYLAGSGITVNNLGIAQKLGSAGVIGLNIMSMGFGEIDVTDVLRPEGGNSTFKPQFFNIQIGFAKEFSNSIHAGIAGTFVTEQIADARASGAAFEAGVQYVTGKRDNFHLGITLRNVGTNMRFSGAGFSISSDAPDNPNYQLSRQTPTAPFQMPTYLTIGTGYDFYLDENHLKSEDDKPKHRLTALLNFTSNSFLNDYFGGGVEYSFREMFMLRAAYRYEQAIGGADAVTMYTGLAAGATIQHELGKSGPILAVDYSYRPTQRPANGVHCFSLRFMTRDKRAAKAVGGE